MHHFPRSLPLLLGYAALVMAWQIVGIARIAAGGRALGPSASLVTAAIALAVAGLLWWTRNRRVPFLGLAALAGAAALQAISNAFRADPSLWPSDLARYLGVAINGLGVCAVLVAVVEGLFPRSGPAPPAE
ncbi:MAG: hypothetical protein AAF430_07320 [Myxococcota bacterium]